MHSFQAVGCYCRPLCLIVETNFIVFCIWWWFCRFWKLCLNCSAAWETAESFYSTVLILRLHCTTRNTANHVTLPEVGLAEINLVFCPFPTDVIHTVGPVARGHVGRTETNDLTSCYQNSLRLMKEHGLSTVVSTVCLLKLFWGEISHWGAAGNKEINSACVFVSLRVSPQLEKLFFDFFFFFSS